MVWTCLFFLVIYYQNVKSYGAGMSTVLSNGIGVVALLMVTAFLELDVFRQLSVKSAINILR